MPKNWVLRATQLRTVSQLDRAIQEGTVSALRQALPYSCDLELLGADLAIAFVQLSPTERTLDFLRSNPPHTLPAAWARSLVGLFVSNTDANAALAMYRYVYDRVLHSPVQAPPCLTRPASLALPFNRMPVSRTACTF